MNEEQLRDRGNVTKGTRDTCSPLPTTVIERLSRPWERGRWSGKERITGGGVPATGGGGRDGGRLGRTMEARLGEVFSS